MTVTVVVGNPKPGSRTRAAGELLARSLTGREPDHVVELAELGPGLLGWGDPAVTAAVDTVRGSDLVVMASPTFKATYTGLLKLFLDQFAGGTGLEGVVAVPLMLGAGPAHAMAPDLLLRPVLTELGGTCAVPGLYLLDDDPTGGAALAGYVERWAPVIGALTGVRA
ncbi:MULTISPECIES: NAD(P)H-dependent oxidoreductase [unclassified Pseudonocardia]|uniref:NADPH-dependent FMN reductase n=1 Tax=unclassified Pseudonocardia TaxID=2619320 RepID=UPI00094B7297|nr:NAD(P)H-dependent oxidoreductase [Pseudonocardia sp. Ae707_Ps1]OLM19448.1 FMN reductase [Pseudonocardia sp. Ae707_Ps1]